MLQRKNNKYKHYKHTNENGKYSSIINVKCINNINK